jgi:hypothetical protein
VHTGREHLHDKFVVAGRDGFRVVDVGRRDVGCGVHGGMHGSLLEIVCIANSIRMVGITNNVK